MTRAATICRTPGCPDLATQRGQCDNHARQTDAARGTKQQRGYDTHHDKLRRHWASRIVHGHVKCARCLERISPTAAWHLDHNDDRTGYLGPSHAACNAAAGGQAAHGKRT